VKHTETDLNMVTPPLCPGLNAASVDAPAAVKSFLGAPRLPIVLVSPAGLRARGIDYSRSHLWRLEAEGRFPKRVKLGSGRVAWIADEVDAYLLGLAAERT
jgi:prophage regulatory protein